MGGKPSAVRVKGPLSPHVPGFRRELGRLGYRPHAVCDQLRLMAHASRWLESRGLSVDELTPARVHKFLAHRRAEGYVLWLSTKGDGADARVSARARRGAGTDSRRSRHRG